MAREMKLLSITKLSLKVAQNWPKRSDPKNKNLAISRLTKGFSGFFY